MKPSAFEYHAPRSLDEALALLGRYGSDAKPLAGGQSLIPAMNFRLAAPAVLVDLNPVAELAHVTQNDGALTIGAMTRHRTVERSDLVARAVPLLSDAIRFVAHAAIRTRGTMGGSLAHADPAAELPAVMIALDARFTLRSRNGARTIPAVEFFTGLFATSLDPGELLTDVTIPAASPRTRHAFQEVSRRHGDFALAGVAAAVTLDGSGRCASVRVALLGIGDRPMLAERAARLLEGQTPTPDAIRTAAEAFAREDIDPPNDIHASSDYRRHLAAVLMRRALERACNPEAA
jgi:CO/xanthine dehydrogenase FAD-binding subunit